MSSRPFPNIFDEVIKTTFKIFFFSEPRLQFAVAHQDLNRVLVPVQSQEIPMMTTPLKFQVKFETCVIFSIIQHPDMFWYCLKGADTQKS